MVPGFSTCFLHQTPNALVLQPVGADAGDKCLVIDRQTAKMTFEAWSPEKFASPSPRKVFGVVGLPQLLLSSHLVVVTAREQVGKLRGSPIWRVSKAEVLTLRSSFPEASAEDAAAERSYADLLSFGVSEAQLYFCLQEDITLTSQAASEASSSSSAAAASRSPARPIAASAAASAAAGHGCGEPRFLWNAHLAAPLWAGGAARFTVPLVCGFVGSVSVESGRAAGSEFTLIARTDCSRVGPRLWSRGVSADGAAANWVETEQIVRTPAAEAAFLQVRGSVPVPWSQPPCLLPKPPIVIAPEEECRGPCLRHLERLAEKHGSLCLVNLLRQVSREGYLGRAYATAAAAAGAAAPPTTEGDDCDDASAGHDGRGADPSAFASASASGADDPQALHRRGQPGGAAGAGPRSGGVGKLSGRLFFTAFDYTAECPAGKPYKLAKLFSQLEPFLEESGFFLRVGQSLAGGADASTSAQDGAAPPFGSPLKSPLRGAIPGASVQGTPAKRAGDDTGAAQGRPMRAQSGVVRTNCLDCLDRTNLVQTLLGERLLALQLSAMGALPKRTATLADAPEAQEALRALWKAQGDAISRGYTGTAALRKKRWLRDAAISLGRYVRNNHADGRRADAAAIISGAYVPRRGAPSPFPSGLAADVTSRVRRVPSVQVAMLLCGFRCARAARAALSFGAPLGSLAGTAASAFAALFWGSLVAVLVRVARMFGAFFVDRPTLEQSGAK